MVVATLKHGLEIIGIDVVGIAGIHEHRRPSAVRPGVPHLVPVLDVLAIEAGLEFVQTAGVKDVGALQLCGQAECLDLAHKPIATRLIVLRRAGLEPRGCVVHALAREVRIELHQRG